MRAFLRFVGLLGTVLLFAALGGCQDESAKAAWNDVVKRCASSDLDSRKIIYFGPSNNVGPGSVWRQRESGGYGLRWTTADMPGASQAVLLGNSMTCDGTAKKAFDGKASLGLVSSVVPASGELSADFGKAKSITVAVSSMSWDTLREGPFELWIKQLPNSNPVKQDLTSNVRLISVRALRVTGFSADLQFAATDAASLKAKYTGSIPRVATGELNAGMEGKWTNDTTLRITAVEFYIAGELGTYSGAGFASGTIVPIDIISTEVFRDKP